MEKHESEQIIKETIEFANQEIKKVKRKSAYIIGGVIVGVLVLLAAYLLLFVCESPVKYSEGVVTVAIPEDKGIDIRVELPNYTRANAVLVKTGEDTYDLYMGIMQTAATKIFKDTDPTDDLLRVGNGIVFDFQGEQHLGNLPNGVNEDAIRHIYYLDDLSDKVRAMPDEDLIAMENKTLVWEK